jgi:hypothetical protein
MMIIMIIDLRTRRPRVNNLSVLQQSVFRGCIRDGLYAHIISHNTWQSGRLSKCCTFGRSAVRPLLFEAIQSGTVENNLEFF